MQALKQIRLLRVSNTTLKNELDFTKASAKNDHDHFLIMLQTEQNEIKKNCDNHKQLTIEINKHFREKMDVVESLLSAENKKFCKALEEIKLVNIENSIKIALTVRNIQAQFESTTSEDE